MKFKVLLRAWSIPDGSLVRKINGEKVYKLSKELIIRGDDPRKIRAEGCVFLICDNSVTTICDAMELIIELTLEELEKVQDSIV